MAKSKHCKNYIAYIKESFSRFYPYILVVSCIFLLITFLVYSIYASSLLTHYTKLMLHVCITLFTAFLVLCINQFHHFATKDEMVLCQISGKFVTTFTIN